MCIATLFTAFCLWIPCVAIYSGTHFDGFCIYWSRDIRWGYGIRKWAWSAVEMDQLMVAACVRLQLENTKDELRGMTQMCTARSDEWPERSCHTTWPKLMNFPAKFHFHKKPGGRNGNTDRQFVTFLRAWRRLFALTSGKYSAELHVATTQLYFYIRTIADTISKSSPSCTALSISYTYLLNSIFGWKNTYLIMVVSSENCNVCT